MIYQVNIRPNCDGNREPGEDFEVEADSELEAARLACDELYGRRDWTIEDGDRYLVEIEDGQIFYAVEEDGDLMVKR